jgi:protein-S-isoprenylcysteine O-methyltransferase Ste14
MQWLELKIPPLLVWLVFAGAMFGVAHVAPKLSFTLTGSSAIALALAVLGGAMAFAGVIAFRNKRTTVNPFTPSASSFIVSGGPYYVSRNPMYVGLTLALAGWAVYLSNAGAALLVPGFVAYMTQYQIKPEERALLMSRVRRWL